MNPIIVISPHGGFGNRLRVLCSGRLYAERHGCRLEHMWDGGPYACAFPHIQKVHDRGFSYFFEDQLATHKGVAPLRCYSEWMPTPGYGWWHRQNYGQSKLRCTDVVPLSTLPAIPTESMMIETTRRVVPQTAAESHDIYRRFFIPRERFLRELPTLPEGTVGISVRRSEFLHYFPEAVVAVEALHAWLRSFETPVVLFSEDKEFLRTARTYLNCPVVCAFASINPEDLAFFEFLTLAKCTHIYGTASSSFAEEAALFGNVPYTPITTSLIEMRPKA